jgi:hypothetical protein
MAETIFPETIEHPQPEAPRGTAPPRRIKFTEASIARIEPRPDGKQFCVWGVARPSFGLRISGRVKVFVFVYRYGGRSRWLTLGRWPLLSLADAIALCRLRYADVCYGKDPASERQQQREAASFSTLCQRYLVEHAQRNKKASSAAEDRRYIERELLPKWAKRPAASISRREILDLIEEINARPARVAANRCGALISTIFAFGVSREIVATSPAQKLPKSVEVAHERVLNDAEIVALWNGTEAESDNIKAVVRLLIMTACRKGEMLGLPWRKST